MESDTTGNFSPPELELRPDAVELWGERLEDSLSWVKGMPNKENYLSQENAHTDAVLDSTLGLQDQIFNEIKSRVKETDLSVPVAKDGWLYYQRTEEGLDYVIHCRRPVGEGTSEQIILDENKLAEGHDYFELGIFDICPSHKKLLWGVDYVGDEHYTLYLRDVDSGQDVKLLEDISSDTCWSTDCRHFLYLNQDSLNRPFQVLVFDTETGQSGGVLYEDPDERFFVGVGREKDDSFVQVASSSKESDEIWVLPADDFLAEPRVLLKRQDGFEYSMCHYGSRFILLTNDQAENFRVLSIEESASSLADAIELVAHDPDVMITGIDVCDRYLILAERQGGYTRIRLRDWQSGEFIEIPKQDVASTIWPGANPEFTSNKLRYTYTSMVTPSSVYEYDFDSGQSELLKRQEVEGYDLADYVTERQWAKADDGTDIPLTLVWKKDALIKPAPCVLYGYGAYEISLDPSFSVSRLSLLDRGFVMVLVHARGGGEMGRQWYLQGKYEKKVNTFSDVVAAANFLVGSGYTDSDNLVIRGGSAGGLLVGAVLNLAPELFAAAVAEVPFVDVINTMLDESLPLTVTEWEEWGNPKTSEKIYNAMRSYSPYDNVKPANYPTMLVTTGLNDPWVGCWEPIKWVQRLRQTNTSGNEILLLADITSGHIGPSGRYQAWHEEAKILAFILWALGDVS